MKHELKCWPEHFRDLKRGKKVEVRKNDRPFKVGDTLVLREYIPYRKQAGKYTGERRNYWITHVLQFPAGLRRGFVALSLGRIPRGVNLD